MEGHIYIYGEITSYQGKDAVNYGAINPREVQDQIQANKEAKTLAVHINSPGGDVDAGFAIYDILKGSGKEIETHIEGQCYSIATVIALAGSVRKATQNSEFLIHNPWTMAFGNADDVQKTADELRRFEDKIANHYASITNMSIEDALSEMKKDTFMDLEQAKEYGFITDIVDTVKAVAKFNYKKENMSTEKKEEKSFIAKMKDLFLSLEDGPKVENVTVKSAEGKDLVFAERTEGEIQIGDKATVEGLNVEGEVLMASGDTYTFEKGELKSIQEKEVEEKVDVVALVNAAVEKAVEPFKSQLEEKEGLINNLKETLQKQEGVFNSLKQLASYHVEDNTDVQEKTSDKKKETVKNVLSLSSTQQN
jgi:ATP-dependent Clp protease protease subunit